MPKISKNGNEQTNDLLSTKIEQQIANISITTDPVMIVGVSRRVGLAHFEHIDLYAGVALPVGGASTENIEELKVVLEDIATVGFNIVSTETYKRYKMLVDAQKGNVEEPPV